MNAHHKAGTAHRVPPRSDDGRRGVCARMRTVADTGGSRHSHHMLITLVWRRRVSPAHHMRIHSRSLLRATYVRSNAGTLPCLSHRHHGGGGTCAAACLARWRSGGRWGVETRECSRAAGKHGVLGRARCNAACTWHLFRSGGLPCPRVAAPPLCVPPRAKCLPYYGQLLRCVSRVLFFLVSSTWC